MTSTVFHERVAQFGPDRNLVGILTQPTAGRRGSTPDLVLLNNGVIHRVGSNRVYVELARALALHGVTTLRFDLSGIGDSERRADVESVRGAIQRDVADAMAYLSREHGSSSVVLFGLCSGAFDAFKSALEHPQVVGAFMVDLPGPFQSWRHFVHHLGARLRRADSQTLLAKLIAKSSDAFQRVLGGDSTTPTGDCVAPAPAPFDGYVVGARGSTTREEMGAQLDALLERQVELYFVFTAGLEVNYNHSSQFEGVFPRAARHPRLSHAFLPDADHAFATQASRSHLIGLVRDWLLTTWLRRSDAA